MTLAPKVTQTHLKFVAVVCFHSAWWETDILSISAEFFCPQSFSTAVWIRAQSSAYCVTKSFLISSQYLKPTVSMQKVLLLAQTLELKLATKGVANSTLAWELGIKSKNPHNVKCKRCNCTFSDHPNYCYNIVVVYNSTMKSQKLNPQDSLPRGIPCHSCTFSSLCHISICCDNDTLSRISLR